jgi:hypothetical protein
VRWIAAVGVALVVASGCAKSDTTTSEARDAYGLIVADPLWAAHPPGYELELETELGCHLEPHSSSERYSLEPKREYTAPPTVEWRTPLDWFTQEGEGAGWQAGSPAAVAASGYNDDGQVRHMEVTLSKAVGGRQLTLVIQVFGEPDMSRVEVAGRVAGVGICPGE